MVCTTFRSCLCSGVVREQTCFCLVLSWLQVALSDINILGNCLHSTGGHQGQLPDKSAALLLLITLSRAPSRNLGVSYTVRRKDSSLYADLIANPSATLSPCEALGVPSLTRHQESAPSSVSSLSAMVFLLTFSRCSSH